MRGKCEWILLKRNHFLNKAMVYYLWDVLIFGVTHNKKCNILKKNHYIAYNKAIHTREKKNKHIIKILKFFCINTFMLRVVYWPKSY